MSRSSPNKKWFSLIGKIALWLSGTIILLILLLWISVNLDPIQNRIIATLENKLNDRTGARIDIGHFNLLLPNMVKLRGLSIREADRDTILFVEGLSVNANLPALIQRSVEINTVRIEGLYTNLERNRNSGRFNFQFILDSLSQEENNRRKGKKWDFNIDRVILEAIHFIYLDNLRRQKLTVDGGTLDLSLEAVNLQSLNFEVSNLLLEGMAVTLLQGGVQSKQRRKKSRDGTPLVVDVSKIKIFESSFNLFDSLSSRSLQSTAGDIWLKDGHLSLLDRKISVAGVSIANAGLSYDIRTKKRVGKTSSAPVSRDNSWRIGLAKLNVENTALSLVNKATKPRPTAFDPNHIDIQLVRLNGRDMNYDGVFSAAFEHLEFTEGETFDLKNLEGDLLVGKDRVHAEDLTFRTSKSNIHFKKMHLANFTNVVTLVADVQLSGALHGGDLIYGMPALSQYIQDTLDMQIKTSFEKNGDSLSLSHFVLSASQFQITANGAASKVFTDRKIEIDSGNLHMETKYERLSAFLPDSLRHAGMEMPEDIAIDFHASDAPDHLATDIKIETNLGKLLARLEVMSLTSLRPNRFSGEVHLNDIALGQLLTSPKAGTMSATFHVNGGLYEDSAYFNLDGMMEQLAFGGHTYRDTKIAARWATPMLQIDIHSDQPQNNFDFKGQARLEDQLTSADWRLNADKVDFSALSLGLKQGVARGTLEGKLDMSDKNMINGKVAIRNAKFFRDNELYTLDSLVFRVSDQKESTEISIESDAFRFMMTGNVPALEMPGTVVHYINESLGLELQNQDSIPTPELQFNLELRDDRILTDVLLPKLSQLEIQAFEGKIGGLKKALMLDVRVPVLNYGGFEMSDFDIHTEPGVESLAGKMHIGAVGWSGLQVSDFDIQIAPGSDSSLVNLQINKSDTAFFKIAASVFTRNGAKAVHIISDSLVLNGIDWNADPQNVLILDSVLQAGHFRFWKEGSEIRIGDTLKGKPGKLKIKKFDLAVLGGIFDTEVPLCRGLLSAEVLLNQKGDSTRSSFGIDTLSVLKTDLGTVEGNVTRTRGHIDLDVQLQADSSLWQVAGDYAYKGEQSLDFRVNFGEFNLATLQPFLSNISETLSGTLDGVLSVKGNLLQPEISGDLRLRKVRLIPYFLNTPVLVKNEFLYFEGDRVRLSNFKVHDINKQTAVFDGTVRAESTRNLKVDLSVNARDFQLFSTEKAKDNTFYGKIIVDVNGRVNGAPRRLKIDGNVALKEGSTLNIVLPQTSSSVIKRDEVVNFVDQDRTKDPFLAAISNPQTDSVQRTVEGMDLQANLDIDENSILRLLMDQQYGDRLEVRGDGNFSLRLRPNGIVNLTGKYELVDGSYYLNFHQIVKRKFDILKESHIQWNGSPSNARLDVEAQYSVETQPPIGDLSAPVPFNVNLSIDGKLLSPELSFGISMPESAGNQYGQVAAYINDINRNQSDLNKQVMSLILFRNFIGSRDLAASTGSLSNTARSSLSRFLTQQLNNLSTGIEGFTIDANLQSYETTDEHGPQGVTNLELGVSQSLFSDRLTISVSGNVYLENADEQSDEVLDYLDDVSIEYELTEAGNFELVGFRRKEYDGLSQGEISKTGVGIIFSKDYDHLNELFERHQSGDKKK